MSEAGAGFGDEVEEEVEHGVGRRLVEVAGRLVGEDQPGRWARARPMATRCCWPPESCSG